MIAGMLIFPEMTQLDFTGPYEVFAQLPGCEVKVIAHSLEPVAARGGLRFLPDTTIDAAPALDVIFVPGGPGVGALMEERKVLEFLRDRALHARYVTSVCTGAQCSCRCRIAFPLKLSRQVLADEAERRIPFVSRRPADMLEPGGGEMHRARDLRSAEINTDDLAGRDSRGDAYSDRPGTAAAIEHRYARGEIAGEEPAVRLERALGHEVGRVPAVPGVQDSAFMALAKRSFHGPLPWRSI